MVESSVVLAERAREIGHDTDKFHRNVSLLFKFVSLFESDKQLLRCPVQGVVPLVEETFTNRTVDLR